MAFEDITDPEAVRRAIEEFEALGQARFLKRYNFGASRGWMLRDGDREYDAQAILGAAHSYQHPALGPLPYDQFHGGVPRVSGRVLAWKRSLEAAAVPSAAGQPLRSLLPDLSWQGPCCAHLLGNLLTLGVILVGQAALSSFGLNAGSRRLNRHRRELAAGLLAHQLGPANVLEVAKPMRRGPPTFEHLGTIRQHDNVTPVQGSVLHQGSNRVPSRLTRDQLGLALLTNALLRSRRFARLVLRNWGRVGQACKV